MNILGLIPARGGSKRIPGKNVKLLGGLPLIAWTIRAAIASAKCSQVVVSTDDENIASVSRQFGATVPSLRPAQLATDVSTSVDVALYELEKHERAYGPVDGLLLLQPTSPFRTSQSINDAVDLYSVEEGHKAIVSVSRAPVHPAWCFRLEKYGMVPYLGRDILKKRSQDLEAAYTLNGAIYLISPSQLRSGKSFLHADAIPFIMESGPEVLDIDTESDWLMAEFFLGISRRMATTD